MVVVLKACLGLWGFIFVRTLKIFVHPFSGPTALSQPISQTMRHTSGSDSIAPVSDHGHFSEPSSSQLEGHTCNVTLSSSILGPLESSGCSFGSLVHEDRGTIREQFMNNTVPQNYKQPKTKKPWRPRQGEELLKHAEAQKKYREKKKQMKEYLETRMKACNEERLALMVQNEQLRGQIYASERLVQYATSMANTLRSWTCSVMEGYQYLEKKALHASRVFKLLSKAVQRRILNAVRSSMDASTFGYVCFSLAKCIPIPAVF